MSCSVEEVLARLPVEPAYAAELRMWLQPLCALPERERVEVESFVESLREVGVVGEALAVVQLQVTPEYARRRGWSPAMAMRELVQNALDVSGGAVELGVDGAWAYVLDRGPGMALHHVIIMGASEKECWHRGAFGEGLKMAITTAALHGMDLVIRSRAGFFAAVLPVRGGGGVPRERRPIRLVVGTDVVDFTRVYLRPVAAIEEDARRIGLLDWRELLWRYYVERLVAEGGFALHTRVNINCRLPTGELFLPTVGVAYPGDRLYVGDIYVGRIGRWVGEEVAFSYNLWGVPLEPNRLAPSDVREMLEAAGKTLLFILIGLEQSRGIDAVVELVDRMLRIECAELVCRVTWFEPALERVKWVDPMGHMGRFVTEYLLRRGFRYYALSEGEALAMPEPSAVVVVPRELEEYVKLPRASRVVARRVMDSLREPVQVYSSLSPVVASKASIAVVAAALVAYMLNEPFKLVLRRSGAEELLDIVVHGFANHENREISLVVDALAEKPSSAWISTLIHEMAHLYSGAPDASRPFEKALDELYGALSRELLNAYNVALNVRRMWVESSIAMPPERFREIVAGFATSPREAHTRVSNWLQYHLNPIEAAEVARRVLADRFGADTPQNFVELAARYPVVEYNREFGTFTYHDLDLFMISGAHGYGGEYVELVNRGTVEGLYRVYPRIVLDAVASYTRVTAQHFDVVVVVTIPSRDWSRYEVYLAENGLVERVAEV